MNLTPTDEFRVLENTVEILHRFSGGETVERAHGEFDDDLSGRRGMFTLYDDPRHPIAIDTLPDDFDRHIGIVVRDRDGRRLALAVVEPTRFYCLKRERVVGYKATEPHYLPYKKPLVNGGEIEEIVGEDLGVELLRDWLSLGELSLSWGRSHHSVWRLSQLRGNRLGIPMAARPDYEDLIASIADESPYEDLDRDRVFSGLLRIREEAELRGEEDRLSAAGRRFRDERRRAPDGYHRAAREELLERYAAVRAVVIEYGDRWFSEPGEGVAAEQTTLFVGA